jgi:hypothetical protein
LGRVLKHALTRRKTSLTHQKKNISDSPESHGQT